MASSPRFFRSGRTTAFLNSDGKQPLTNDLLNDNAINGESNPRTSLTSHVGAGSSWTGLAERRADQLLHLISSDGCPCVQRRRCLVRNVVERCRRSRRVDRFDLVLEKGGKFIRCQRSRLVSSDFAKHDAEVRFGGSAEASLSTRSVQHVF